MRACGLGFEAFWFKDYGGRVRSEGLGIALSSISLEIFDVREEGDLGYASVPIVSRPPPLDHERAL